MRNFTGIMSTRRGRMIPKIESRERPSPRNLRTKTPSVNELRKKFKVSPKGKRKLDFLSKGPLAGKSFYLDLQGYCDSSQLKKAIGDLGGGIEEFFHKDVNYLVTNRKDADYGKSPSSQSTPSPGTPSPFPFTRSSSVKDTAIPSPMSTDSPQSIENRRVRPSHDTRGRTFVKSASAGQKRGTTDVLSNASTWGVNVFHIDQVLKWISQLMAKTCHRSSEKQQSSTAKRRIQGKVPKVVTLRDSFLKVEDLSFKYRPLVHEFKVWPEITFDGSVVCPFDPPRRKSSGNDSVKRKGDVDDKSRKKVPVQERPKHGYCECCEVRYSDLDSHLKGDQHQTFARTDSNYASLDEAINDGPTLQDFLNEVRGKKKKDHPSIVQNIPSLSVSMDEIDDDVDDVFLLSSPTHKSRVNQTIVRNEKLPWKNLVKAAVEGSNSAPKGCLDKNIGDDHAKDDLHKTVGSLRCRAVNETRTTLSEAPSSTACKEPGPTTMSLASVKEEVINSSDKQRTLSEVTHHHGENRGKISSRERNHKEDATNFAIDFRRSTRCHHKANIDGLIRSEEKETDQSPISQDFSENPSNIFGNKRDHSGDSGPLVLDENERINERHSLRRKLDVDSVKCFDGLQLSPILPCNPNGCSVLSSCSVDAGFLPSGLPVYSSLGSSFGDVSRGVNSLVKRIENESNSERNNENFNPNSSELVSPVSVKSSPKTSVTSRNSGSGEESSSVIQSSCREKCEKSVLQIPLDYLNSNTITSHDFVGSGNENDSLLIKRKRSPNEGGEHNKARKCKRMFEESDQDSETKGNFLWNEISNGFTPEGSEVSFQSCIAERVKLQRALSESCQILRQESFLEGPKSSPRVPTTSLKRRNGSTSSPFVELTNIATIRRGRAKSFGGLRHFNGTARKYLNQWNKNGRSGQSRSACLTPNDPYSFNDPFE